MKTKLLLFFSLCCLANVNAQCGPTLPPPGYSTPAYGLDTDNDGFAIFDIGYYIEHIDRPKLESFFGVSSSGYTAIIDSNSVIQPLLFSNTVQNQVCSIGYVFNGSGPEFEEQPPCYYPVSIYLGTAFYLITVPHDGDDDNDGISNADEDANNNLNLMDDDDDSDGIINLKDATNNLATVQHTTINLNVYPNPITKGVLTFDSNVVIAAITIYDITGKQVLESKVNATSLPVDTLTPGIYFVKFQAENGNVFKKIAIR